MQRNESRNAPVIAIDGPAGAGKSTVAAHLARRFGLLNLETGAMYRALALRALQTETSVDDRAAILHLLQVTTIVLEPDSSGNRVLLNGDDVTSQLRTPEITAAASRVSVHGPVRSWMVGVQRSLGLAAPSGVVMEGRDIGTVVFPDADLKIFLDASPEARGDRRFAQGTQTETRDAVIAKMQERDIRDRTRSASPLEPASDAILLNTSGMTLQGVLQQAENFVLSFVQVR